MLRQTASTQGVLTFFVPAALGADVARVPALHAFGKRFFKVRVSDTPEKLKDMMKLLDAHSGKLMDRHLFLRDASDDVTLARRLVKAVLGRTATWPEDDEVDGLMQSQGGFLDFGCSSWPQDVADDPHDNGECGEVEDSDTEELSRWEVAGSFFGESVPNGSAVPVMDDASGPSEPIPITQGTCDVALPLRQGGRASSHRSRKRPCGDSSGTLSENPATLSEKRKAPASDISTAGLDLQTTRRVLGVLFNRGSARI